MLLAVFFKERVMNFYNSYSTGTFNLSGSNFQSFNGTNSNSRGYSTNTSSHKLSKSRGISGQSMDSALFSANVSNTSSIDSFGFADLESTIETGRVEKGDASNQDFKKVDIKFETTAFHILNFKLLPVSQKETITTQEIRMYCPSCSYRKRKPSWKFCPSCGEQY